MAARQACLLTQTGTPVGWRSIAPREEFRGLERYRKLARIDDAAVWSVTCFFIDRLYRRRAPHHRSIESSRCRIRQ